MAVINGTLNIGGKTDNGGMIDGTGRIIDGISGEKWRLILLLIWLSSECEPLLRRSVTAIPNICLGN